MELFYLAGFNQVIHPHMHVQRLIFYYCTFNNIANSFLVELMNISSDGFRLYNLLQTY
ncbi:hypothetical protein BDC45DRAFT_504981 [Circinella umbellata]|nr:hypothetical protein BDC45DRAFT_504981 [Circinella umbellata]